MRSAKCFSFKVEVMCFQRLTNVVLFAVSCRVRRKSFSCLNKLKVVNLNAMALAKAKFSWEVVYVRCGRNSVANENNIQNNQSACDLHNL